MFWGTSCCCIILFSLSLRPFPPSLRFLIQQHLELLHLLQERVLKSHWQGIMGDVFLRLTSKEVKYSNEWKWATFTILPSPIVHYVISNVCFAEWFSGPLCIVSTGLARMFDGCKSVFLFKIRQLTGGRYTYTTFLYLMNTKLKRLNTSYF